LSVGSAVKRCQFIQQIEHDNGSGNREKGENEQSKPSHLVTVATNHLYGRVGTTEIKTIITMFVVASGAEGVTQFAKGLKRE
jgi:hypothetical protein